MRAFTRIAWASASCRQTWEPRIAAINAAWLDVEVRSVVCGLRAAALVFGTEPWIRPFGLPYQAVEPGRWAVGDALTLAEAHAQRDDERVGQLLGFPLCCRQFFHRVWNAEQKIDTTLAMADQQAPAGWTACNILGRWLGVRLVPHLPCGFHCEQTMALERDVAPLWPPHEYAWAREILNWPVAYSALHGIAIVTLPILKVVTHTDYTAHEQIVRRLGSAYPMDAPRGLGFPFDQRPKDVAFLRRSA